MVGQMVSAVCLLLRMYSSFTWLMPLLAAASVLASDQAASPLSNIRQLTSGGTNAEAYWSPDGKRLIFTFANFGIEGH
jgi:dipeptidyl aminopeptidase/acylaminoacyl peptidase